MVRDRYFKKIKIMIDNIKIYGKEKHGIESHIIENGVVELTTTFNSSTGEIQEYPKRGKDYNLEISLNQKSSVIKGSLHKYHNIKNGKGDQNHDDFYYSDFADEIGGLLKKYNLDNSNYLTNLEFGINLSIEKDPQIIINTNLLMNNCKAPNKNLKFAGKGDYKEFQVTGYIIKVYNKSKQYNLDHNVLRIELKILNRSYLRSLGVNMIDDLLNKDVLLSLYGDLKSKIWGLVIVDSFDNKNIPQKDLDRLNNYTNPHYWIRLKSLGKTSDQIYKLKKNFHHILKKYELLKTKKEILSQLDIKFFELLELRNVA